MACGNSPGSISETFASNLDRRWVAECGAPDQRRTPRAQPCARGTRVTALQNQPDGGIGDVEFLPKCNQFDEDFLPPASFSLRASACSLCSFAVFRPSRRSCWNSGE